MEKAIDKDGLIDIIAKRSDFSKGDVKVILDTIISVFEEAVKTNTEIKVRGFGHLYSQILPARLGKDKIQLPETIRVIFRLAENIRFSHQE